MFDPGTNDGHPQPDDEIHAQIGANASGIAVGKQITQNVTQHFYNSSRHPPTLSLISPPLNGAITSE